MIPLPDFGSLSLTMFAIQVSVKYLMFVTHLIPVHFSLRLKMFSYWTFFLWILHNSVISYHPPPRGWGGLQNSKDWIRLLWRDWDSVLSRHCCFLTVFPSFLHSLKSLIINPLNLFLGTQERSRRLKPFLQTRNEGHGKAFVFWRTPQVPSLFQSSVRFLRFIHVGISSSKNFPQFIAHFIAGQYSIIKA